MNGRQTPRAGVDGARGRAERVQDVGDRERIVGVAPCRVGQQHVHARIERVPFASREAVEELRRGLERRLLLVIERRQHAQRRERGVGVEPAPLPPFAGDPPGEAVGQRALEQRQPVAAAALERFDLAVGHVAVRLEEVAGELERAAHHLDHLGAEEAVAVLQQRRVMPRCRMRPPRRRRRTVVGCTGEGGEVMAADSTVCRRDRPLRRAVRARVPRRPAMARREPGQAALTRAYSAGVSTAACRARTVCPGRVEERVEVARDRRLDLGLDRGGGGAVERASAERRFERAPRARPDSRRAPLRTRPRAAFRVRAPPPGGTDRRRARGR